MGPDSFNHACDIGGGFNNTCVYEDVSNKAKGCKLRICELASTSMLPPGWKYKGTETDLARCPVVGTIRDNIWVIEKYQ
jgi:hypothetical protein